MNIARGRIWSVDLKPDSKDEELSFVWFMYYWGTRKAFCISKQKVRSKPGFVLYIGGQYFIPLDIANYEIG